MILDDYVVSNLFATKGSREFYLRNSFNIYKTRAWDRRSSKKNEKRLSSQVIEVIVENDIIA